MLKLFRGSRLQPLTHQSLPISRAAAAAFRLMAQAKHIEKIVLTTQDADATPLRMVPAKSIAFSAIRHRISSLAASAASGSEIAKWLVASGAHFTCVAMRK